MSDSEKLPTDEQNPEPTFPSSDADISHLSIVAIHMNELYKHLQKHGFDKEDALHLTGMVLSSGILFKYIPPELDFDDEEMNDTDFEDPDNGDFV